MRILVVEDTMDMNMLIVKTLKKNGYSVDMMDHRGHGFSSREVEDLCKVTISSFDVYVEDLKAFLNTVVKPSMTEGEKLFASSSRFSPVVLTGISRSSV